MDDKHIHIYTGSAETEWMLRIFVQHATSLDAGVPRKLFDDYYMKIMTVGRNGPGDAYEGSQAPDDTGGFFEERGNLVYLTEKAKQHIHV